MDLTQDCPHCTAMAGEICTKECTANGEKIKTLEKTLWALDLSLKDIKPHD